MRPRHRPRPAPAVRSAFAGFRLPADVIVLAVRWYLRFGLSYRDVEDLLAERGVEVDHVTIQHPNTLDLHLRVLSCGIICRHRCAHAVTAQQDDDQRLATTATDTEAPVGQPIVVAGWTGG
jgi:hypothetical protein